MVKGGLHYPHSIRPLTGDPGGVCATYLIVTYSPNGVVGTEICPLDDPPS